MCTVTFLPTSNSIILTSNRDEDVLRANVLAPATYGPPGRANCYPLERASGGTWFIVNDKGDCGVILNGANLPHLKKDYYAASRGKLLPLIFCYPEPLIGLKSLNLGDFEPFTIILYAGQRLYKCIWDGMELQLKKLDHTLPQIWSSVTLYDLEVRLVKMRGFIAYLNNNRPPDWASIYQYHKTALYENSGGGADLKTLSITSASITAEGTELFYHDLIKDEVYTKSVVLETANDFTCRY